MDTANYFPHLDGEGLRIGIVQSRFNEAITDGITDACTAELEALGLATEDILLITVPGCLEVPLALQKLAATEQFDALIALGAVVRGDTYHFEIVSNESASGITRVGLDFEMPISNGILTTDTTEQAHARMSEKGRHAAQVAVEMANMCVTLEALSPIGDES